MKKKHTDKGNQTISQECSMNKDSMYPGNILWVKYMSEIKYMNYG